METEKLTQYEKEVVKYLRFQTNLLSAVKKSHEKQQASKTTKFLLYALLGAMASSFVAAAFVYLFLIDVGPRFEAYNLLDVVLTNELNSDLFNTTELLFIALNRFLLGFGLTWLPLTVTFAVFDHVRDEYFS